MSWMMLTYVPNPVTNPVYFLSIIYDMYFYSLGRNLISTNLYIADNMVIGLNWSSFGMSGHTFFRGINLASNISLSLSIDYGFHRSFSSFLFLSFLMKLSLHPSLVRPFFLLIFFCNIFTLYIVNGFNVLKLVSSCNF